MTEQQHTSEGPAPTYGPRFALALGYAAALHADQRRKGGDVPYISHPLAVASLVAEYGGDEDQAIAALLHDAMEDCGVTREGIEAQYGGAVAAIVADCTDSTALPKPPWRPRKQAYLSRVPSLPPASRLVIACDKLHNAHSIGRDLHRAGVGEQVWNRFSAPADEVRWYYRSVHRALGDGWSHAVLGELGRAVAALG